MKKVTKLISLVSIFILTAAIGISSCGDDDTVVAPPDGDTGDTGSAGTMGGYTWETVGTAYADDVTSSVSTSSGVTTISFSGALSFADGDKNAYATTGDGVSIGEDFSSKSTISYTVDNQTATNIQVTVAVKTGSTWEWWEGHYNPDSGTEIAAGSSDTYTLDFTDANDWKSDVTGWSYGVSSPADLNDVHEIIFKVMIPEDGAGPVSGDVDISGLTIN